MATFDFDLFVVHAEADSPFVHGHLLPAIGLSQQRVLVSSELAPGAWKCAEIERGVASSRLTVVVLSPAYVDDRWAVFGEQLAAHASALDARLVPLLLADCQLPLRIDARVSLDFRDRECWDQQAQRLRAVLQRPEPTPSPLPCPYPGMRAFSADTAAHFHGRNAEIDELIARLRAGEREIYIIGPSGSGKSSLVSAGVQPRLAQTVSGLGPVLVWSMRPGEQPTARLGEAISGLDGLLAAHAPGTSVLVVIDQLEELFTLTSADERNRFVELLRAVRHEPRCAMILVLRADFFGALMDSPLWTDRAGRISRIEVAPLRGDALREAIVRPARNLGVYFEPELLERLLADSASEPGILPLLQEALVDLWDRRRHRLLTLVDYLAVGDGASGGLAGALSRHAATALRALSPAQEPIARRILLRLVSFGEGRSDTRRQQSRSKLRSAADDTDDFDVVLQRLIDDRLLTADDHEHGDDARIDLAHEVMITAWPTLASWLRARRGDEQRRRQLEAAAAQWIERGRGAGGLFDPIELADANVWRRSEAARELGESAEVAALIAASQASHDRQRRRRRRGIWAATVALGTVAVVVALAILARGHARAEEARRREVETRGNENRDLMFHAYQEEARRFLDEDFRASPYLPVVPPLKHRRSVADVALSPDGARIVTASHDHTARVWDATSGQPLSPPLQHRDWVRSAAFSPDGSRVVTASDDHTARIWNAISGQPLTPPLQHQNWVWSAAFSPDGSRIVTASYDNTAGIWDATSGQLVFRIYHDQVRSAAFSPDGTRIVTNTVYGPTIVWDAITGKLICLLEHDRVVTVAFSPDGARIVTGNGGEVRIWDTSTCKTISPLMYG